MKIRRKGNEAYVKRKKNDDVIKFDTPGMI